MELALLLMFAIALLVGSDATPASEPERIVVILPQQSGIGSGGILLILLLALIGALVVFGQ